MSGSERVLSVSEGLLSLPLGAEEALQSLQRGPRLLVARSCLGHLREIILSGTEQDDNKEERCGDFVILWALEWATLGFSVTAKERGLRD